MSISVVRKEEKGSSKEEFKIKKPLPKKIRSVVEKVKNNPATSAYFYTTSITAIGDFFGVSHSPLWYVIILVTLVLFVRERFYTHT